MKPSSAHVSLLSEKITMAAIVLVLVHAGSGGVRMHGRWLAGVVSLYLFQKYYMDAIFFQLESLVQMNLHLTVSTYTLLLNRIPIMAVQVSHNYQFYCSSIRRYRKVNSKCWKFKYKNHEETRILYELKHDSKDHLTKV